MKNGVVMLGKTTISRMGNMGSVLASDMRVPFHGGGDSSPPHENYRGTVMKLSKVEFGSPAV
jgi:hypothetical protein